MSTPSEAWTLEAYAKWVALIGLEPLPMTVDYAEAIKVDRFDLLYLDDDLAALIQTARRPDHLLVENVAVRPGFQGRGLGQALLAHVERLAASLGYSEIRLYTNKLFVENIKLYEKIGYRVDREEDIGGRHVVHMTKPVHP
jgi:ribosomal protein S18 acetylase RimI-like enzyme